MSAETYIWAIKEVWRGVGIVVISILVFVLIRVVIDLFRSQP